MYNSLLDIAITILAYSMLYPLQKNDFMKYNKNIALHIICRSKPLRFRHYFFGHFVFFFSAILSLIAPLRAQDNVTETEDLSLNHIIEQVIRHNDKIIAARFMEQAAQAKIGPAAAWDDPMLMIGVNNLPPSFDFKMDDMTMKMIGLRQNIPYSGYKGLQKKAARFDVETAKVDRERITLDLIAAAKIAHYNLYSKQQALNELIRQKDLMEQLTASALSKLKTNQMGQDEYLNAQSNLWKLESEILSATQEVDEAKYNLNALRGASVEDMIPQLPKPEFSTIPVSAAEWINKALANAPEPRRLYSQSQSYLFSSRAADRMSWPMLALSAEYGFREGVGMNGPRDNMISFRAEMSLPFFFGRQQKQMARSMKAMSQSIDAEIIQAEREIRSRVTGMYHRAERLTESLKIYHDRIIPTSEEAFKSAYAGYTVNKIALTTLINYAVTLIQNRVTRYQLEFELGRTIAEAERYITSPDELIIVGAENLK
jgi:outer membrane protein TolC